MTALLLPALQELAQLNQWVAWAFEGQINPRTGKRKKMPKNPNARNDESPNAKANNPATWASYDEACRIALRKKWAGIGFEFFTTDPYTGVDIDKCISHDGVMHPLAQAIIEALNSYTEVSPSGRGVKIFCRGTLPKTLIAGLPDDMGLEMYSCGHYFTVTGNHLEGTPTCINDSTDVLATLFEQYGKPVAVKPTRAQKPRTNTGTNDAYPAAWVKVVVEHTLNTAVGRVASAPSGLRHFTRRENGYYLGGLLAWLDSIGYGCLLNDTSAADALYHASIPEHNGNSQYASIQESIERGRDAPLDIPPPEPRHAPQPSAAPWVVPAQQTTTVNQRYISLGMPATKVLLVKSPIGTGKTVATAAMIPADASVLVITHRVALGQQQAERFNTDFYKNQRHDLEKCTRLTITLDSLYKLPLKPAAYDFVVIDESEQVLTHLSGKTISPGERRMVLQYLAFFLTQAKNVVYLDADLGALTHNFATRIHGADKISIIHNEYKPANRSYVAMPKKADLLAILKINITAGQTAYVAINSKTAVHALERDLATFCPALRIMAISGENSHTPESQHFICNVNTEITNYDVVIASPSLGTGVSIDTVYFDAVYLVGEQKINTAADLHQMAGRVRTIKSGTVYSWISPQPAAEPVDPAILRQWAMENWQETGAMVNIDRDTGALSPQDTDYLNLWSDIRATRNASMNALAQNFYHAARANGHTVTVGNAATESERRTAKVDNAAAREAIAVEWYAAVIGAIPINTEAYERLDRQENHTEEERAQMVQYDIRTFYEEPLSSITPELIKSHVRGLRGKIIKLAHLMAPDLATHADVVSADYLLPDQRNAAAAAEMRRDMLLVVFNNNSLNFLSLTNNNPSTVIDTKLTAFTAYCAAHRIRIKRLLNISVDAENEKSVVAARCSLREQLGLNATNKQNTTGKRTYALDADVLATVTAYAARYIARERARIADNDTTAMHPAPQPAPAPQPELAQPAAAMGDAPTELLNIASDLLTDELFGEYATFTARYPQYVFATDERYSYTQWRKSRNDGPPIGAMNTLQYPTAARR